MTTERKERPLLTIKWKHLKFAIPAVVSILSGSFSFGYFIQREVNKVPTSRLQIEIDKMKVEMEKDRVNVKKLQNQIRILNSNLLFFKIDRNYYQAYNDYKKDSSNENLQKWVLAKKQYVKYLQYRRQLLKELKDSSESDEMFTELSETAIFISGAWYKIPNDVLMELE